MPLTSYPLRNFRNQWRYWTTLEVNTPANFANHSKKLQNAKKSCKLIQGPHAQLHTHTSSIITVNSSTPWAAISCPSHWQFAITGLPNSTSPFGSTSWRCKSRRKGGRSRSAPWRRCPGKKLWKPTWDDKATICMNYDTHSETNLLVGGFNPFDYLSQHNNLPQNRGEHLKTT